MSTSLLTSRRFAPLFWCQFFSAFSDNFLKNALTFLIVFHVAGSSASLTQLAAAVFIAPYFFLSALGGQIADRHDKAIIAQRLKLAEIGVAVIAVVGFVTHSLPVLFVALFGFGVIGSLFGPIKYGILPDLLPKSALPGANALVEGATFLAILLGTIVGGLAAKDGGDPASFSGLMLVFALLCWGSSLFIPEGRLRCARSRHLQEHRHFHHRADQSSAQRPAALVGRAGDELVLAGRRRGAFADAGAGEERGGRQRKRRHHLPRHILDCGGGRVGARRLARLRPHRAAAHAGWRGGPHRLRARSRLGNLGPAAQARAGRRQRRVYVGPGPADGDRSRRSCDLRAVSTSSRPSPPSRPGPAPIAAPA